MTVTDTTFGGYLAELRHGRGMSQRALALKADLRNSTIARIESGLVNPDPPTLMKLAVALGVDKEILMTKCGYSDMPADIILLARKSEQIPEEDRQKLLQQLNESIDDYLRALEKEKSKK